MRLRKVNSFLKFLLALFLMACQTPVSQHLASQDPPKKQAFNFSKESIYAAQKRIRPNTQDRLVPIRDKHQKVVSWAVVYDPPIPASEHLDADSLINFSTQATYSAYEDLFPHNSMLIVADFMQPVNITYAQYDKWYGSGLSMKYYGGWKNHPDLWISHINDKGQKDTCSGRYQFKYNGSSVLEFWEQRYAGPSLYRNLPGLRHGLVHLAVPKTFKRDEDTASISKTEACDGTSPQFEACLLGDCGAAEKPQEGEPYCPSHLMDNLDGHYQYAARLERELEALEENLATGAFDLRIRNSSDEDFSTQGLTQEPFSIASSDPGSTIPVYGDEIIEEVPGTFRAIEKDHFEDVVNLATQRLKALQTRISALGPEVLQILDPERRDTYSRFVRDSSQELLRRIQTTNSLKGSLAAVCPRVLHPDPQPPPEVDIIYAGLTNQEDILIQGKVLFTEQAAEGDKVFTLDVDFDGNIELLDTSSFQVSVPESGFFSIRIPSESYRFTEQYFQEFSFEGPFIDLYRRPHIPVNINAQFQTKFATQPITSQLIRAEDTKLYGLCATPGSSANYYCRRLGQEKMNYQIIDAEAMLNALKNSNSETVFNNFDTTSFYIRYGAIFYVGASNTLLEVVVPVSVVDLVPGEKVAGMGFKGLKNVTKYRGRIWEQGSKLFFFFKEKPGALKEYENFSFSHADVTPLIYEGQLFFRIKNVTQKQWEKLGEIIPQRYHSMADPVNKFSLDNMRGAFDYMQSSLPKLEQELNALNAGRFPEVQKTISEIKKELGDADKFFDGLTGNIETVSGKIGKASGFVYELQLLKKYLADAHTQVISYGKKYPIEPHLQEPSIKAQEVDLIILRNGVKTIIESKVYDKYPVAEGQLTRLISVAKLEGIQHIRYVTGGAIKPDFREKFMKLIERNKHTIDIDWDVIEHD